MNSIYDGRRENAVDPFPPRRRNRSGIIDGPERGEEWRLPKLNSLGKVIERGRRGHRSFLDLTLPVKPTWAATLPETRTIYQEVPPLHRCIRVFAPSRRSPESRDPRSPIELRDVCASAYMRACTIGTKYHDSAPGFLGNPPLQFYCAFECCNLFRLRDQDFSQTYLSNRLQ